GPPLRPWPLVGGALAFFLASTALVAVPIAIEKGESYARTWNTSLRWTLGSHLGGIVVALAAVATFDASPVVAFAVMLAPCWVLLLLSRSEAARRGAQSPAASSTPEAA